MGCDFNNLNIDAYNTNISYYMGMRKRDIFAQRFIPGVDAVDSFTCLHSVTLKLKRNPNSNPNLDYENSNANLRVEIRDNYFDTDPNLSIPKYFPDNPTDGLKAYKVINFSDIQENVESDITINLDADLCDTRTRPPGTPPSSLPYWIVIYLDNYAEDDVTEDQYYAIYGANAGTNDQYLANKVGATDWQLNKSQNLFFFTERGLNVLAGNGNLHINNVITNIDYPRPNEPVSLKISTTNVGSLDVVEVEAKVYFGPIVNNMFQQIYSQYYSNPITCNYLYNNNDWIVETQSFTMPPEEVIVEVITYHGMVPNRIEDERKYYTVNSIIQACDSATLIPSNQYPQTINPDTQLPDIVTFTLHRDNPMSGDLAHLIEQVIDPNTNLSSEIQIGECLTDSQGYCTIDWTPETSGTHTFFVKFDTGCSSDIVNIYVDSPIPPPQGPPLISMTVNDQTDDFIYVPIGTELSIKVYDSTPYNTIYIKDLNRFEDMFVDTSDEMGFADIPVTIYEDRTLELQASDGSANTDSNVVTVIVGTGGMGGGGGYYGYNNNR